MEGHKHIEGTNGIRKAVNIKNVMHKKRRLLKH